MIPAGGLEPGSTCVQWTPAAFCPVPGKTCTEALPKFRPGCLDHQIGTVIPLCHPCGAQIGQARIEGYRCADDGSGVWMRFRIISLETAPHEHE